FCRSGSSELETDVVVKVGGMEFYLHKFPLLSKSNTFQRLLHKAAAGEGSGEIELAGFPGGPKAFEMCAKFCYGITVTLNAYNVVAARCAAEYLEMTEEVDRGNLVLKIDVFLNSSVLRNWKDSIIVLQSTGSLLPWSEDLKVVGKCIDAIASKTSVDPSLITWSYAYSRKQTTLNEIIQQNGTTDSKSPKRAAGYVPRDWWIEDLCELDVDLYKRVMVAIKSKGRMDGGVIGEALKAYAVRWLPESVDALLSEGHILRNKSLVETIICLLPSDKGASCSCSFLLKLLKVAVLIGADDPSRDDLMRSVGAKLDGASVDDLLIPSRPPQTTVHDVDLVLRLAELFAAAAGDGRFVLANSSSLKVGKLIDGYLSEVGRDPNLSVSSFTRLAQSVAKSARPIHDGLYRAIDEHKSLSKQERKALCGLMDVRKLTTEAAMHAAQNEQLPVRVVVQVLFFEQAKAAAAANPPPREESEEPPWGARETPNSLRQRPTDEMMTTKEAEGKKKHGYDNKKLLPSRSKRIFDKFWPVMMAKGTTTTNNPESNNNNKSSETSIGSQSPTSVVAKPPSLRNHHRHSIS
ncbi:hypothetical protein M569_04781, partial [Genlisea aurea]